MVHNDVNRMLDRLSALHLVFRWHKFHAMSNATTASQCSISSQHESPMLSVTNFDLQAFAALRWNRNDIVAVRIYITLAFSIIELQGGSGLATIDVVFRKDIYQCHGHFAACKRHTMGAAVISLEEKARAAETTGNVDRMWSQIKKRVGTRTQHNFLSHVRTR